jgi:hypothetical protein
MKFDNLSSDNFVFGKVPTCDIYLLSFRAGVKRRLANRVTTSLSGRSREISLKAPAASMMTDKVNYLSIGFYGKRLYFIESSFVVLKVAVLYWK